MAQADVFTGAAPTLRSEGLSLSPTPSESTPFQVLSWNVQVFMGNNPVLKFIDLAPGVLDLDLDHQLQADSRFINAVLAKATRPYQLRMELTPKIGLSEYAQTIHLSEQQTRSLLNLRQRSKLQACLEYLIRP